MMLPTTGPKTSLMEDLQDLGLVEDNVTAKSNETLGRKSDAEGGDWVGPDDGSQGAYNEKGYMQSGDKAAGSRKEVQVRSDGNFKKDAKNEDDYDDDVDVVSETESAGNGKMVPAFLIPSEQDVQEAEEQAAAATEADKLNRAWEVINTYFAEDVDGLNEEGLRGVINAAGYALNVAVEDIANLTVENERVTEAVNELTGLLYEAENSLYEMEMNYNDKDEDEDKDEDGDEDKDEDEDEDEGKPSSKKLPPWMQKESRRYRGTTLTEDRELSSLASELRYIGESRKTRAIDVQSELIEGYESVRKTCADVVDRIIDVMAEDAGLAEGEELEICEDDERVQIARFFESIVDDATRYLDRLADGDVPFKVAEADLGKLYGDMEKGVETMHTVE